ncbi:hypothetical protein ACOXVJ_17205 [Pseudomonas knackmussii]|uniref:hypothetical protein n=1 Tax=Pseudomonas knackmussii TaxID=65741 RepID=UPI003BDF6A7E
MSRMARSMFWLAAGFVSGGLGLFLGFLGITIVGAAISGSGCGSQCTENSENLVLFSKSLLASSILFSIVSVRMAWIKKNPAGKYRGAIAISVLSAFIVLVSGAAYWLLLGF